MIGCVTVSIPPNKEKNLIKIISVQIFLQQLFQYAILQNMFNSLHICINMVKFNIRLKIFYIHLNG